MHGTEQPSASDQRRLSIVSDQVLGPANFELCLLFDNTHCSACKAQIETSFLVSTATCTTVNKVSGAGLQQSEMEKQAPRVGH